MSETFLRYIELLKMLRRDCKIAASELHRRLEVKGFKTSRRTVERDLQMLAVPFNLECDESSIPYGWRYAAGVAINVIPGLSEAEALSFLMLKQFSSRLLPNAILQDLDPYFRAAKHKLASDISKTATKSWPNKVRRVDPTQALLAPKIDPEVHRAVYSALFQDKQIEIAYQGAGQAEAKRKLVVNPLGLVEHGVVHYLVVNYDGYDDVRTIALHRIRSVTPLGSNVNRPTDFDLDDRIAKGELGFGRTGNEIAIELRFYNGYWSYLRETPLSTDQWEREESEESVLISATVLDTPKLRWWLLSLGDNVEVVKPKKLRDDIRRAIGLAARRYHADTA